MKSTQRPGSSILIVDDNAKNLEILGKLLQVEKYEIEFAINGEIALDWLHNKQFDLVLLDINMPGMTGFEVCRKIRSNPQLSNIPVIFLSADTDRESIFKGFELGAQDYVTKPFDSRELIMRVKTHLSLKKSREELEELNLSLEEKVKERTFELNEAKERAEASDRLKTAFMNNISHEVRTPLNGILGFAQLIIKPDITDEKKNNYLEILESSGQRLLNTITNFMDISLIVSGNQKTIIESFVVADMLKNINEKYKPSFAKKRIALTCEIPSASEKLQVLSDYYLITKIIDHIVDNALKFTNQGNINFGFIVKEKLLEFFVKDTGVGITDEAQKRIFDYFTQGDTSNTRGYEGSGLGLAISKGLVKLLNGEIWCESEVGKGSIFYFSIPI